MKSSSKSSPLASTTSRSTKSRTKALSITPDTIRQTSVHFVGILADAIKTVSGALTKINKKSQHAGDQKMILATHRVAETTNPDCSRLYMRGLSSVTRSTPVTTKEMRLRVRFAAVAAAVAARKDSLEFASSDQAAFLAQKDSTNGKKTMKAYLWSVCAAAYDAEHPQG